MGYSIQAIHHSDQGLNLIIALQERKSHMTNYPIDIPDGCYRNDLIATLQNKSIKPTVVKPAEI